MTCRVVVLLSGRGSNLRAIVEARLPIEIVAVIGNRPQAEGLAYARERGLTAVVLDHTEYPDRAAFDARLADEVAQHRPDLVVLAGYMRILSPAFIARFEGRLLNIHPALLPMFPGLNTHERALAEGVKIHGCTVHFVTVELDHGPIVAQAAVPVRADDTPDTLAARVLAQEHRIYPQAIRWFAEGRLVNVDGRVNLKDDLASQSVLSPGT
ncbi:MAG: phosphoribosylglycinamide formyltransferase [Thiobacillus sp. 63-78]|uniref:phosphoribosylglycinamide formyltransferase n=1 Tax=Thiobacillus sp. 63-78 TaxID=1895859 RepID=UPI000969677A|nr:phosphoribosylglycinamide formyltransferase [Thiobacillus sp. 63-78]MBN8762777.1 phosphoribosylglycinamide formyltransferase [Thiobacillus sp.]MBN8773323.1 phosphoribosylglycinamide formyltransferase [Thiobacillus sp.]OJZ04260.1 MAG: phosphoribosylglycinamide formyltransferase [Thiobacillus sp. 63-78]